MNAAQSTSRPPAARSTPTPSSSSCSVAGSQPSATSPARARPGGTAVNSLGRRPKRAAPRGMPRTLKGREKNKRMPDASLGNPERSPAGALQTATASPRLCPWHPLPTGREVLHDGEHIHSGRRNQGNNSLTPSTCRGRIFSQMLGNAISPNSTAKNTLEAHPVCA